MSTVIHPRFMPYVSPRPSLTIIDDVSDDGDRDVTEGELEALTEDVPATVVLRDIVVCGGIFSRLTSKNEPSEDP